MGNNVTAVRGSVRAGAEVCTTVIVSNPADSNQEEIAVFDARRFDQNMAEGHPNLQ